VVAVAGLVNDLAGVDRIERPVSDQPGRSQNPGIAACRPS
jgi:hypothetical protein